MAELEAKTKSLTPSPANVNMQSGSDRSSTSSSPEDQSGNTSSVEVVQNQNLVSVDFRSLDFNAEAMDLSLFTDFGKVIFQSAR